MKLKFNDAYFVIFIILLFFEIVIAVCVKSGFIRHTFGDYLVTILMYCFFKSFLNLNVINLSISVLAFAFVIEFYQLINILEVFNLQNNKIISIILGTTFQFTDLIAYTLGIVTVLAIEFKLKRI